MFIVTGCTEKTLFNDAISYGHQKKNRKPQIVIRKYPTPCRLLQHSVSARC
jgi:hypothetical protein